MSFADRLAVADGIVWDILGDTVTYTPGVGDPVEVTGVFDKTHQRVDLGEPGITSQGPAVSFLIEDLPSDPETDSAATVTHASITYRAHEVRKDGTGVVTMLLHQTA